MDGGFTILDCSLTNLKQYFRFIPNEDGSMYIVRDEGLVLTPKDKNIVLEKSQLANHQAWYLNAVSDSTVQLVNKQNNQCLHMTGSDYSDTITIADCNTSDANQAFEFVSMDLGTIPLQAHAQIVHSNSNKCLRYTKERDLIKLHDCLEGNHFQTFKLESQLNGSYKIVTLLNEILSNEHSNIRDNNQINTWYNENGDNYEWYIIPQGFNKFTIKNKRNNNRCMNTGDKPQSGTNILTSDCQSNEDFYFYLRSIELTKIEEDVFYTIKSAKENGKCFTTQLFEKPIQQMTCDSADLSQLFKFIPMADNTHGMRGTSMMV
jgi:hypothetical protein